MGNIVNSYLHPWDERFHALVAKHILETPLWLCKTLKKV